jgi:serine/threonine protein kinase/tetratricopeptide (TPR) repeat protein
VIGQKVGPYAVVERLGGGGMGEVYLAEDTRLGRRVALKRPSESFLSAPDARDRLHREASAAGRLTHPNIAAVYDVLDVDAYPYIVMEYVEGENLSTVLERGPLSVERALDLGLQIADALAAAHARGVIHRDLKPGNISLTADGIAKVLDFGIAKGPDPGSSQASAATGTLKAITAAGQVMGTPGYSSPEQMVGAAADPRDDIYSLGVVLYEVLTGRRPFQGGDALELAVATMTKTAPLPHQVNPAVPPEVSVVIARAIARDRDDRYGSARELGEELRRVSRTLSTGVTGPISTTSTVPIARPVWKRAWPIVLLVIASWAVPLGLWWRNTHGSAPASRVPVVAVLPFANNSTPADVPIAAGMRDVLIANLGALPGISVLSRAATTAESPGREDPRRLARNLGASHLIDGSLQRSGSDLKVSISLVNVETGLVLWSSSYSAAEKDIFSLQERIAEGVARAGPIGTSGAHQNLASKLGTNDVEALSRYGQAVEALERPDIPGNLQRATGSLKVAIDRDPNFALAFARLGDAYWATYQATSEPKWATEAVTATNKALTLDQQQPDVWISLARIHQGTGRREEALNELNKALSLQANSDEAHQVMGQVLQSLERLKEAEEHYLKAVALRPNYWRHHSLLGGFYYATGRGKGAVAAFTRATELQPDNARGFNNLGAAYYALGDNANALKFWQHAVTITPMPEVLSNIGNIHYVEGRYEEARASFQQAVIALPNDGLVRGNLGDALARLNRDDEARQAWREAVRLDRQALVVNPNDATTLARIALREAKLGDRAAAETDISRALSLNTTDAEVLYHSAVVRALAGDSEGALTFLDQALKNGYSATLAARDRDLDAINDTARFRALVSPAVK